jgi:hypothetical protein
VKMYNRTNINPILNTLGSQNSVTTGVSISHTQSFNKLKDIWRSARARRDQNADVDVDQNEEGTPEEDVDQNEEAIPKEEDAESTKSNVTY